MFGPYPKSHEMVEPFHRISRQVQDKTFWWTSQRKHSPQKKLSTVQQGRLHKEGKWGSLCWLYRLHGQARKRWSQEVLRNREVIIASQAQRVQAVRQVEEERVRFRYRVKRTLVARSRSTIQIRSRHSREE